MMDLKINENNNEVVSISNESLELLIDDVIDRHRLNKSEINNLALQCVTALSASDAKNRELYESGKLKTFFNFITGKNDKLKKDINHSLANAQMASQLTLQKLAENDLLSIELITAINYKLNSSIKYVNDEFKNIYSTLISVFKLSENKILEINKRIDNLERNIDLLNWINTLEFRSYNGVEYFELSQYTKIMILSHDFFNKVGSNVKESDILILKNAIKILGLKPHDEVEMTNFLKVIFTNDEFVNMLVGVGRDSDSDLLPITTYLKMMKGYMNEKRFIIEDMLAEYANNNIIKSDVEIANNLCKRYLLETLGYDINENIKVYDLVMMLVLHFEVLNQDTSLLLENYDCNQIDTQGDVKLLVDNNLIDETDPNLLKVWDIININTIVKESDQFYYYFEKEILCRVNKGSCSVEKLFDKSSVDLKKTVFDIMNDQYLIYLKEEKINTLKVNKSIVMYSLLDRTQKNIASDSDISTFFIDEEKKEIYWVCSTLQLLSIELKVVKYAVESTLISVIDYTKLDDNNITKLSSGFGIGSLLANYGALANKPISQLNTKNADKNMILVQLIKNSKIFLEVVDNKILIQFANIGGGILIEDSKIQWIKLFDDVYEFPSFNNGPNWRRSYNKESGNIFLAYVDFDWNSNAFVCKTIIDSDNLDLEQYFLVSTIYNSEKKYIVSVKNKKISKVNLLEINLSLEEMDTLKFDISKVDKISSVEFLLMGSFKILNLIGDYLYAVNLDDNERVYRYNLNSINDIAII